jgi:hypothetical protein
VPVPNRLFPSRVGADPLDGQIDFDQALGVGHAHELPKALAAEQMESTSSIA